MKAILFEDSQLLVCNKPAGLPVQPDQTRDTSLLDQANEHCKKEVFLVHRIDRPVSGLVLLAKTKEAATLLQAGFQQGSIEKKYLAAVEKMPEKTEDTLRHFLSRDGQKKKAVVCQQTDPGAEAAVLHYRWVRSSERYHLLEITLETGRFHQIRAQLAEIGCIVKGDVKYGARRSNRDRSIHLHAWKLSLEHPFSGELLSFTAPIPAGDPVWNALGVGG